MRVTNGDIRALRRGPLVLLAAGLLVMGSGCGGDDTNGQPQPDSGTDGQPPPNDGGGPDVTHTDGGDGGVKGPGVIGTVGTASNDPSFTSPFDATPSPDGTTVYFTAIDSTGAPAVFSAPAAGGTAPKKLTAGSPLVSPYGISISDDGNTLYIADMAADNAAGTLDYGQIFTMPSAGGMPAALAGAEGFEPRGIEVLGATIYFTGTASDGTHGVFTIGTGGGAPTAVKTGTPFLDPSGVAVLASGDTYVADTTASGTGLASILKVSGGTASVVLASVGVGYPAGIAVSQDGSALLVSGIDPASGTDVVIRYDLASMQSTSFNTTIKAFSEAAGLHRGRNTDTYAWADSEANNTGTVFTLSK